MSAGSLRDELLIITLSFSRAHRPSLTSARRACETQDYQRRGREKVHSADALLQRKGHLPASVVRKDRLGAWHLSE